MSILKNIFASTPNDVAKMLIHLSRAGNSISEEETSEKYVWCLLPLSKVFTSSSKSTTITPNNCHHQNKNHHYKIITTIKIKIIANITETTWEWGRSRASKQPGSLKQISNLLNICEFCEYLANSQAAWNKLEIFWIFVNIVNIWQTARQPDIHML